MKYYDTVKALCDSRGMSIHRLEMLSGLGNGTIAKWKDRTPSLRSLDRISRTLEIPAEVLLKCTGEVT